MDAANNGMMDAANEVDDLQRGIQLAFAVPETHVASAIGYLARQTGRPTTISPKTYPQCSTRWRRRRAGRCARIC